MSYGALSTALATKTAARAVPFAARLGVHPIGTPLGHRHTRAILSSWASACTTYVSHTLPLDKCATAMCALGAGPQPRISWLGCVFRSCVPQAGGRYRGRVGREAEPCGWAVHTVADPVRNGTPPVGKPSRADETPAPRPIPSEAPAQRGIPSETRPRRTGNRVVRQDGPHRGRSRPKRDDSGREAEPCGMTVRTEADPVRSSRPPLAPSPPAHARKG